MYFMANKNNLYVSEAIVTKLYWRRRSIMSHSWWSQCPCVPAIKHTATRRIKVCCASVLRCAWIKAQCESWPAGTRQAYPETDRIKQTQSASVWIRYRIFRGSVHRYTCQTIKTELVLKVPIIQSINVHLGYPDPQVDKQCSRGIRKAVTADGDRCALTWTPPLLAVWNAAW